MGKTKALHTWGGLTAALLRLQHIPHQLKGAGMHLLRLLQLGVVLPLGVVLHGLDEAMTWGEDSVPTKAEQLLGIHFRVDGNLLPFEKFLKRIGGFGGFGTHPLKEGAFLALY